MRMTDLNPGAKTLYAVVANSCGFKDRCWPSQAYLATSIGQCVRSVQNYLRELVEAGLIGITPGRFGNVYRLLPHPAAVAELKRRAERLAKGSLAKPHANPSGEHEKIAHGINIKTRLEESPHSPPSAEADVAFEQLWRVWPVREARKAALRIWRRLWRSASCPKLEAILASIKAHLALNPKWKRGFIPQLGTWLRGRRWEDDLPGKDGDSLVTLDGSASKDANQNAIRQKEKAESLSASSQTPTFPDQAQRHLDDVMSHWPIQMTPAETLRAVGLWKYLYFNSQLPSNEKICTASECSTVTFLEWLHAFQTAINYRYAA